MNRKPLASWFRWLRHPFTWFALLYAVAGILLIRDALDLRKAYDTAAGIVDAVGAMPPLRRWAEQWATWSLLPLAWFVVTRSRPRPLRSSRPHQPFSTEHGNGVFRILIFNWRDIRNPAAGGAEVLTHQMARRWVAHGDTVTLFTSRFPGAAAEETVDGVRIVRAGNPLTVYWHAYRFYRKDGKGRYDLVIDEVNTIPFFTPWYVKEPIVLHFNQLAREIWFYESWWPVALCGFLAESLVLIPYRQKNIWTISESSRKDLLKLGFRQKKIYVLPMGKQEVERPTVAKEAQPTLLYVGRLKRSKRVDHCLWAFHQVLSERPNAQLWIVGNGTPREHRWLQRLAQRLKVQERVTFFGYLTEEQKLNRMARAHLLMVPSVREGWGLIVTEANALGTPAVVYPVPGLRDSTQHEVTGLVCRRPSIDFLARETNRLLRDQDLYQRLRTNATAHARLLTWDRTAQQAREFLAQCLNGMGSTP